MSSAASSAKGGEIFVTLKDDATDGRAVEDVFEEVPDGGRRRLRVAVDQFAAVDVAAGEVELHDAVERELIERGVRVGAVVDAVGVQVGDVEEQAATGRGEDGGDEAGFGHFRAGQMDGEGDVFDDQRRGDAAADVGDIGGEGLDGFACERQRGEMADLDAARAGEGDVLAPPRRIKAFDEAREVFEIGVVEAVGAAEREVQAVRDEGEMFGEQIEFGGFSGVGSK